MVKSVLTVRIFTALALCLLLMTAQNVQAATIEVNKDCSLGDAIQAANTNKAHGSCPAGDDAQDTIVLTRDARPRRGILPITSKIVFEGRGHSISLDNDYIAFEIRSGELTLKNLNVNYRTRRRNRVIEVWNGRLTIADSRIRECEIGIHAHNSAVTIRGKTAICDLPASRIITGSYTGSVDITAPPQPNTCAALPGGTAAVSATKGLDSGVQCQQVDAGGIGIPAVIEAGFIDAVDVWGYVEQGVEICFPQLGSITFLDAAAIPRAVTSLPAWRAGNMTCVSLDRPGTVVLAPLAPGETLPAGETSPAAPAEQECAVRTTANLNLRETPAMGDNIIGHLSRGVLISPLSRTTYWVQVNYSGKLGWIGAKYVQDSCGDS